MKKIFLILFSAIIFLFFGNSVEAQNAVLYLSPSNGTFSSGSTFNLSIYVDTKGNTINAIEVNLTFPPELLQITNSTAGESFISEWLTPPSYSNSGGTISFKGGIPNGIVTSAGLVSTITFRAKSSGNAKIEFSDSSKILLKDGKGTPITTQNLNGTYEIMIPAPEGPRITSLSHPDSSIWYADPNPNFFWEKEEGATDFSFDLNQSPYENPDTISEGVLTSKFYENIQDGLWYFHLRSKNKGVWGKASHFLVKIDTASPQEFKPEIDAYSGLVYFETKDIQSGMDHYEISAINQNLKPLSAPFFIEASSPFKIPFKEAGDYNIIIKAFDKAGNYQTADGSLKVLSPFISFIKEKGVQIKNIIIPWWFVYIILILIVLAIIYIIYSLRQRGFRKGIKEIREALNEIKKIEGKEQEAQTLKEKFEEEKGKLEEKLK